MLLVISGEVKCYTSSSVVEWINTLPLDNAPIIQTGFWMIYMKKCVVVVCESFVQCSDSGHIELEIK